jgi:hypothetical protein
VLNKKANPSFIEVILARHSVCGSARHGYWVQPRDLFSPAGALIIDYDVDTV